MWCALLLYYLQFTQRRFSKLLWLISINLLTGERVWAQWSKTIAEQGKRNGEIEMPYRWIELEVSPKSEWFHPIPPFKRGWASWNALWVPKGKLENKLESSIHSKSTISYPWKVQIFAYCMLELKLEWWYYTFLSWFTQTLQLRIWKRLKGSWRFR